jgi:hypothetical protein
VQNRIKEAQRKSFSVCGLRLGDSLSIFSECSERRKAQRGEGKMP